MARTHTDVKLAVNEQSDERGVLGFVTDISSKHESFVEWSALYLASMEPH